MYGKIQYWNNVQGNKNISLNYGNRKLSDPVILSFFENSGNPHNDFLHACMHACTQLFKSLCCLQFILK